MPASHRQEAHPIAATLLGLQRTMGNRCVQRLLSSTARADGNQADVPGNIEDVINRERAGGQALDNRVRAQMEQSFNFDFSAVHVHTGTRSQRSQSRSQRPRIHHRSRHLFFREGEYNPGSFEGRKLLAHELTHVVQQSGHSESKNNSPVQLKTEEEEQTIGAKRMAAPGISRTRNSPPAIQRWKISGNTAISDTQGDTLWGAGKHCKRER